MKRTNLSLALLFGAALFAAIVVEPWAVSQEPAAVAQPAPAPRITVSTSSPDAPAAAAFPAGPGQFGMLSTSGSSEEQHLAAEARKLLGVFADTEDSAERGKLRTQLRGVLESQFDGQRKRREGELAKLEEKLKKLSDLLHKRNEARQTIIDRRLDQLTVDADGLGWLESEGEGFWSTQWRNDESDLSVGPVAPLAPLAPGEPTLDPSGVVFPTPPPRGIR